jgi:hypothetical protein
MAGEYGYQSYRFTKKTVSIVWKDKQPEPSDQDPQAPSPFTTKPEYQKVGEGL